MLSNSERFIKTADELINKLEEELSKNIIDRPDKASDSELKHIISRINILKNNVGKGHLPPKTQQYSEITRLFIDYGWPLNSQLGGMIAELEGFYKKHL